LRKRVVPLLLSAPCLGLLRCSLSLCHTYTHQHRTLTFSSICASNHSFAPLFIKAQTSPSLSLKSLSSSALHSCFNFPTTYLLFCLFHTLAAKCRMHHLCTRFGYPFISSLAALRSPWCRSEIMQTCLVGPITTCRTCTRNQLQLSFFSPTVSPKPRGISWLFASYAVAIIKTCKLLPKKWHPH